MSQNFPDNTLYEMDNLDVLRGMNSHTIDLIATDPPFNTKRNRSGSAGQYVDNWKWGDTGTLPDQWKWNEVHPKWLEEIKDNHTALYHAIDAAKHCQGQDTAAFLCFLSVRLIEMHRILKPTGSLYLHCDHTANAYIRMAMDAIFGKKNFRNEIVWCYTGPSNTTRWYPRKHDTIFFYAKSNSAKFNRDIVRIPYNAETLARRGRIEGNKSYISPSVETTKRRDPSQVNTLFGGGKIPEDWWQDIAVLTNQSERTGSPDQKPIKLYERIIKASSNEGDLVLDPFCGCATTIIAANTLNRRWIGIDRRKDARYHIITRLMGITKKERKRLEKYATDTAWLDKQTQPYEMHYQTEPPVRTDIEKPTSPTLAHVYPIQNEHQLSHAEMHTLLTDQFGIQCWGCNFIPPDKRYLHLDHIIPKMDGGTNDIDNRALLCQPCNTKKSNKMSLNALRRQNKQEGYTQHNPPIDLKAALTWTQKHLIQTILNPTHQLNLNTIMLKVME